MDDFLLFAAVGLLAQLVDGALGMAFGLISSTTLLAFGVPPANASAAIHAAEMFTTAASGTAHFYHRNIDWKLFWRLTPFGIAGGVTGAYVLTSIDGDAVKPYVTAYLGMLGLWLLVRSFRKMPAKPVPLRLVAPLGAAGGFLDAAGGGGWGPIVASGLLGAGGKPRYVIGTVNSTEFLVATSISIGFLTALLTGHWEEGGGFMEQAYAIGGLVTGGLLAAPFAGWVVRILPERLLLLGAGTLITCLAAYQTGQVAGWW